MGIIDVLRWALYGADDEKDLVRPSSGRKAGRRATRIIKPPNQYTAQELLGHPRFPSTGWTLPRSKIDRARYADLIQANADGPSASDLRQHRERSRCCKMESVAHRITVAPHVSSRATLRH
nr:hypothetical protein CFP56_21570 [Quercus suber]